MRFGYLLHNNNHADWERHQTTDRSAPPAIPDAHQLANDLRLIVRHVLPNALPTLAVVASLGVGGVILVEAGLDFLGFGIHPPTPSWGNMLSNAQGYFTHSTWLVFLPGTLIFLTVLSFNLLGNAVRDAFDPRLR